MNEEGIKSSQMLSVIGTAGLLSITALEQQKGQQHHLLISMLLVICVAGLLLVMAAVRRKPQCCCPLWPGVRNLKAGTLTLRRGDIVMKMPDHFFDVPFKICSS